LLSSITGVSVAADTQKGNKTFLKSDKVIKELYIVPGARHIDLYDGTDIIPFDKLVSSFSEYLK
jgi:hypothetical protein